MRKILSTNS